MRVAVHQSQYLPWPPYLRKIAAVDHFVVMDDVQFHRGGVQNRNRIGDASTSWWLTVSVPRGAITDRIIDKHATDERWADQHWRSIENTYRRATNFDAHAPSLGELYAAAPNGLAEINRCVLDWMLDRIGLARPITALSTLGIETTQTQRLVDCCVGLGATTYVSGTGAAEYLEVELFTAAGVVVEFLPSVPPRYERGAGAELEGLSMLDMLFHASPATVHDYLEIA